MGQKLVPRRAILLLIAGAVILPIAVCVVSGFRPLLVAMGGPRGGDVLKYVAWGLGILWVVDVVCLVLAQGLNALTDTDDRE